MEHRIEYPFKTDHDLFIALIEDFNTSIASLDRRMVEDHSSTLEIKSILQQHFDTLSRRIDTVEKQISAMRPEEIASLKKDVQEHKQWIHDFKLTRHIVWTATSGAFLLIGYYIPYLVHTVQGLISGK